MVPNPMLSIIQYFPFTTEDVVLSVDFYDIDPRVSLLHERINYIAHHLTLGQVTS